MGLHVYPLVAFTLLRPTAAVKKKPPDGKEIVPLTGKDVALSQKSSRRHASLLTDRVRYDAYGTAQRLSDTNVVGFTQTRNNQAETSGGLPLVLGQRSCGLAFA